jgi:hypothetical protein
MCAEKKKVTSLENFQAVLQANDNPMLAKYVNLFEGLGGGYYACDSMKFKFFYYNTSASCSKVPWEYYFSKKGKNTQLKSDSLESLLDLILSELN